ncbi:FRG domain-containing protein [Nitrosomonas communis]|uniref:FRG domain-containing protein n=1 Tax=Nitrosomonas communis TaxID=44574 RepID=A0A1I4UD28_9PROT|nr:FRG domain-containing protein [Nitrosomonas communis]SFM86862.1 FRG domain-containing protein [Nitrosomonas communis]
MIVNPSRPDTRVIADGTEWVPTSFEGFLHELHHVTNTCQEQDSLVLFRGHRERKWLLESTFARSFKSILLQNSPEQKSLKQMVRFHGLHWVAHDLLLKKYEKLVQPSTGLIAAENEHGIDAYFELMKRIQQYPDEPDHPHFLKGTNFLDWTLSLDVALYFANEEKNGDGAIFICDATAAGPTLQKLPLLEVLKKMREQLDAGQSRGGPLLFNPPKQILNHRAKNQQAVYFAQMNLLFDLNYIWKIRENDQPGNKICIKLVLPAGSEAKASKYLEEKGVNHDYIYPDKKAN